MSNLDLSFSLIRQSSSVVSSATSVLCLTCQFLRTLLVIACSSWFGKVAHFNRLISSEQSLPSDCEVMGRDLSLHCIWKEFFTLLLTTVVAFLHEIINSDIQVIYCQKKLLSINILGVMCFGGVGVFFVVVLVSWLSGCFSRGFGLMFVFWLFFHLIKKLSAMQDKLEFRSLIFPVLPYLVTLSIA